MASKAYRRKQQVKELKKQKKGDFQKQERGKKRKSIAFYTVGIILFAGLIYLLATSASAPGYFPGPDNAPFVGPDDARVTVTQFGCYTCPFTQSFNVDVFPRLIDEYGDRVKFAYRTMPIYSNSGSERAAMAAWCAEEHGLFWEYHELLFSVPSFSDSTLRSHAQAVGLDEAEFNECLSSRRYRDVVRAEFDEGRRANIRVTPTIFINNTLVQGDHLRLDGAMELSVYRRVLDEMLTRDP